MSALLHYAYLKGVRDRSLPVFVLILPVQTMATLIGAAVLNRRLTYPLNMNLVAGDIVDMAIVLPWTVASLSAFWTLRSELATRAIDSFVIASRPIMIVGALVVFAAATAIVGVIAAIGIIALLTTALPANIGLVTSSAVLFSLLGASLGALYVTISPQPATLVWAIIAGFPLAPWLTDAAMRPRVMMIAGAAAIVAVAVSTFLLRRRCAS